MLSQLNHFDRKKLLLLSYAVCIIAASYAILRPLKSSVFFQLIGKEYYPLSKLFMVVVSIPCVAWYSKLVDTHKKHVVLYILFTLYTAICFFFALLFAHPAYGLAITQADPYRIPVWIFSMAVDFYPTFVIGTIWAFINSISTPDFAKNGYSLLYVFVKIGGLIATAGSALANFYCGISLSAHKEATLLIPALLGISGILTISSLLFIAKIVKTIPPSHLVGYHQPTILSEKPKAVAGILDGIKLLATQPYVFGIFVLYYCYDVIYTVIEYQTYVIISLKTNNNANHMNFYLLICAAIAEAIGLIFVLFITPRIHTKLPLKIILLIVPIFTYGMILTPYISTHFLVMLSGITLLPAVYYSLHSPAREMLFIPTIKEVQFKSKAWMDSFGRTITKSSASAINLIFTPQSALFFTVNTSFSLFLATIWGITSYFMGKQYQQTIDKNEVIGKNSTFSEAPEK